MWRCHTDRCDYNHFVPAAVSLSIRGPIFDANSLVFVTLCMLFSAEYF